MFHLLFLRIREAVVSEECNKKLNKVIDHNKPILYIPLAMPSEIYQMEVTL